MIAEVGRCRAKILMAYLKCGAAFLGLGLASFGSPALAQTSLDLCAAQAGTGFETGYEAYALEDNELVPEKAVEACLTALADDPSSSEAKAWLARSYLLSERPKDALPLIEQGVSAGFPLAHFLYGRMYQLGYGVVQEHQKATEQFRLANEEHQLATDTGYAPAYSALGVAYESGQGVEQDFSEALRLYRLSAELGYSVGQSNLGSLYLRGVGVEQDFDEGNKWTRMAAEAGWAGAESRVFLPRWSWASQRS